MYADLVAKGQVVLMPMTEHAPFDLVAYDGRDFHRLQVKYRSSRAGAISVQFRSTWADRNGTHSKTLDKGTVDVIAIYCPETDTCYYVRPAEAGAAVTLRVAPSGNGQQRGVRPADLFRVFPP